MTPWVPRRGTSRIWLGILIGVPLFFALSIGGCAILLATSDFDIFPNFDNSNFLHRQRLQPIPVPQTACPHLDGVRTTASQVQSTWLSALGQTDEWPATRRALEHQLDRFQWFLADASANTPPPVAEKLDVVRWLVTSGRGSLSTAADAMSYIAEPDVHMFEGLDALGDASDLVGNACGAPLY